MRLCPAKAAAQIEVVFGVETWGTKEHCMWVPISPIESMQPLPTYSGHSLSFTRKSGLLGADDQLAASGMWVVLISDVSTN